MIERNVNTFVVTATNMDDGSGVKLNFWVKLTTQWDCWFFTVLQESEGYWLGNFKLELYDITNNGVANYTTGADTSVLTSTLMTIQNPVASNT